MSSADLPLYASTAASLLVQLVTDVSKLACLWGIPNCTRIGRELILAGLLCLLPSTLPCPMHNTVEPATLSGNECLVLLSMVLKPLEMALMNWTGISGKGGGTSSLEPPLALSAFP